MFLKLIVELVENEIYFEEKIITYNLLIITHYNKIYYKYLNIYL